MVLQQHLSEKLQEKQPLIVLVLSVDKVSDACKNTNSKFINQFFGKKTSEWRPRCKKSCCLFFEGDGLWKWNKKHNHDFYTFEAVDWSMSMDKVHPKFGTEMAFNIHKNIYEHHKFFCLPGNKCEKPILVLPSNDSLLLGNCGLRTHW